MIFYTNIGWNIKQTAKSYAASSQSDLCTLIQEKVGLCFGKEGNTTVLQPLAFPPPLFFGTAGIMVRLFHIVNKYTTISKLSSFIFCNLQENFPWFYKADQLVPFARLHLYLYLLK